MRDGIKGLLTLMAGTLGSQIIGFLFTPAIARLYGPEAFGVQGVFMSGTTILAALMPLAFANAVSVADNLPEARALARLALVAAAGFALLTFLTLTIAKDEVAPKVGLGTHSTILLLLPAAAFGAVGSKVLTEWLFRKGEYHVVARMSMTRALATGASKVGAGFFLPLPLTLVLINTIGPFIGAAAYVVPTLSRKRPARPRIFSAWLREGRAVIAKYREFPVYRAPQNVLSAVSQGAPVALVAAMFGVGTAGQYAMAVALLSIPVTAAGGAVLTVMQRQSLSMDPASLGRHLRTATLVLLLIAVPAVAAAVLWSPQVFSLVLGSGWAQAGHFAKVLAPLFAMQLVTRPSAAAIGRLRLQRALLLHEIISLALRITGLLAGYAATREATAALVCYCVAGSLAYGWLILSVSRRVTEMQRESK